MPTDTIIDSSLPTLAGYKLSWVPPKEAPPERFRYKIANTVRADLPRKVDLREFDSPIENQGQLGSCTAFGWAGAVRYRDRNRTQEAVKLSSWQEFLVWIGLKTRPVPPRPLDLALSHLFIYYNERMLEGTVPYDNGASVGSGAQVVSSFGTPKEDLWPYDIRRFAQRPPQAAYDAGKLHTVPQPASIDNTDLRELRSAPANGHLVVFGFLVATSFSNVGSDGVYVERGRYEGGHCVTAVGYDDDRQVVIVRNSWGTQWGANGYFLMPYRTFTNPRVTSDAWTITG